MDKLNYLVKTLSRTNRKDYENYIINAIYSKVGNYNLIPVTQQYIKRGNGFALIDLYFPQINFAIEIDEKYHNSNHQKDLDLFRQDEVFKVLNNMSEPDIEHIKIDIEDDSGKLKTELHNVNKQIDNLVTKIKNKIHLHSTPLKWENDDCRIEKIKESKCLLYGEAFSCSLAKLLELFNKKYKRCQRCFYHLFEDETKTFKFWSPILALENINPNFKNEWTNTINEQLTLIVENPKDEAKRIEQQKTYNKEVAKNTFRITFANYRNHLGLYQRKFIGVFKIKEMINKGTDTQAVIFELVQKNFDLTYLIK
ncbi:MAG: hypothetical protein E7370_03640 [Clostridiales bacterium]|nr:hypothetical protein [Clostridiales bacterium]